MSLGSRGLDVASKALEQLRLIDLRGLCVSTGLQSSASKRDLVRTLPTLLGEPRFQKEKSTRILSLDMGIRNFAYCVCDVPSSQMDSAVTKITAAREGTDLQSRLAYLGDSTATREALGITRVTQWKRIDASAIHASPVPINSEDGEDITEKATAQSFALPNMATLTYKLVTEELLPQHPDVILIELQRLRSGGSASVLQWTLRVHMLECMLYAVFETLHRLNPTKSNSTGAKAGLSIVQPVQPKRVANFWIQKLLASSAQNNLGNRVSQSKIDKRMKIDLAESWLQEGLSFGGQAANMRDSFLAGKKPVRARSKSRTGAEKALTSSQERSSEVDQIKKRDDLADCLLQGMAWIQWEINRRSVVQMLLESQP